MGHGVLSTEANSGFDGVAVLAIGWNIAGVVLDGDGGASRDIKLLKSERTQADKERPERDRLVETVLVKGDDEDMELFLIVALGLLYTHSAELDGRDSGNDISLRKLMLLGFRAERPVSAKLVFVSVPENDGSDEANILVQLDRIQSVYKPGIGDAKHLKFVAEGDQKTWSVILKYWMQDYRSSKPRGLQTWLIPVPGHWHTDKTCMTQIVKKFCLTSGLQEVLKHCGLAKGHIENFEKFSHCRKLRQVFCVFFTATGLEAIAHALAEDPDNRMRVENCEFLKEGSPEATLPAESSIKINPAVVTPAVIGAGRALFAGIRTLCKNNRNIGWHFGFLFLQVLGPYIGFNIFARLGQPRALDKFFFKLAPLLELTGQILYQKL